MSAALVITGGIGFCVGLASWFAILIYGIKAIRRTREGVSLWSRETLWNPVNVLLRPALLTQEGRTYRRRCFTAVIVFLMAIGLPAALALLKAK